MSRMIRESCTCGVCRKIQLGYFMFRVAPLVEGTFHVENMGKC